MKNFEEFIINKHIFDAYIHTLLLCLKKED